MLDDDYDSDDDDGDSDTFYDNIVIGCCTV